MFPNRDLVAVTIRLFLTLLLLSLLGRPVPGEIVIDPPAGLAKQVSIKRGPAGLHFRGAWNSFSVTTRGGKRLGLAVCAAATARLIRGEYTNIYLRTDDPRLPAIQTYLRLGYEPFLYAEDMAERWQRVYGQLGLEIPEGGFAGTGGPKSNSR